MRTSSRVTVSGTPLVTSTPVQHRHPRSGPGDRRLTNVGTPARVVLIRRDPSDQSSTLSRLDGRLRI
jgi:hypothetical protein